MAHPLMRHQIEGGEIPMSDFRRWSRIQVVSLAITMPVATICGSALLSMVLGQFSVEWPAVVVFGLMFVICASLTFSSLAGFWSMATVILDCGLYANEIKVSPTVTKNQEATAAFDRATA